MKLITYIFGIILILLGLTFALLNASPVKLNYYVGSQDISLSLLLVLTLGMGIFIGFIAVFGKFLKYKQKNHQLKTRIKQLEQEALSARALAKKEE